MAFRYSDRVRETTTTTGTGTITLAGAVSNFQSFLSGIGTNNTCYYVISHQTASEWEVGLGTLDMIGTGLARTSVISSSTLSLGTPQLISFSSGTKDVFVTIPSISQTQSSPIPGGRLTLTSGTPVTVADVANATTIYYAPYFSNRIDLYDGALWRPHLFSELSLSIPANTLTANRPKDVFIYNAQLSGANTPTLETGPDWTSDTARSTALTLQDGILVKSGDATRRYVGTIRSNAVGTRNLQDTITSRFVWNYYNRTPRMLAVTDATASWSYNTATWRQARATATNQVDFVVGIADTFAQLQVNAILSNSSANQGGIVAVGYDTTTNSTAMPNGTFRQATIRSAAANAVTSGTSTNFGYPGIGYHFCSWNEIGTTTGTTTWYSSSVAGITGFIIC
jgi:hypothetical protein